MGKYEVTFAEWDACVSAGGCSHRPDDEGWGRGSRPVIDVSWNDAQAYVAWLNRSKVGAEVYRLPSEAEWEYAARGGSTTAWSWGDDEAIICDYANLANPDTKSKYALRWEAVDCPGNYLETAPAGAFKPNPFGLFDMHGNVWEWVQDCWNGSYRGAPSSGDAWMSGYCSRVVLRGGSWYDTPEDLRSAYRGGIGRDNRTSLIGFRVARVSRTLRE